jgi:hypothetical protein
VSSSFLFRALQPTREHERAAVAERWAKLNEDLAKLNAAVAFGPRNEIVQLAYYEEWVTRVIKEALAAGAVGLMPRLDPLPSRLPSETELSWRRRQHKALLDWMGGALSRMNA